MGKTVLGQEKKSVDVYFKRFFDTIMQKYKGDSVTLKQLNSNDIAKKDFSGFLHDFLNVETFNVEFNNKFQKPNVGNDNEIEDQLFDENFTNYDFKKQNKPQGNSGKQIDFGFDKRNFNFNNIPGNKININLNNSNLTNNPFNKSANNSSSNLAKVELNKKKADQRLKEFVKNIDDEKNNIKNLQEKHDCCIEEEFENENINSIVKENNDNENKDKNDMDIDMFNSDLQTQQLNLNKINNNPNILQKSNLDMRNKRSNNLFDFKSNEEKSQNFQEGINKIRTNFNLQEKIIPENENNKKKMTNSSILNFIGKGKKNENDNKDILEFENNSESSDLFSHGNVNNLRGKRKNKSDTSQDIEFDMYTNPKKKSEKGKKKKMSFK